MTEKGLKIFDVPLINKICSDLIKINNNNEKKNICIMTKFQVYLNVLKCMYNKKCLGFYSVSL